jgi:hypothetical protein
MATLLTAAEDRTRPYTMIGIRRMKCLRCGKRAHEQWKVCADGKFLPLCRECDVLLNDLVLGFFSLPRAERVMRRYARRKAVWRDHRNVVVDDRILKVV